MVSSQQRAESEFRRATGLLNQGRVAKAVDACKRALQADKRNAEAADAFRRAKSAGGLNADLLTFVDRRPRQLR